MDHVNILKRAFHITRRYKVLWIFGILLALFSGGSGGSNINFPAGGRGHGSGGLLPFAPPHIEPGIIISIALTLFCLLFLFLVVALIISYVARTALYRLVDQIEESGECPTWQEGFRLGWSRRALRLLGIDLVIGIPFAILAVLLLLLALSPLLLLLVESDAIRVLSVVLTIGAVLLVIGVLIVVGVIVRLLKRFMHRQAALDDRSIGESLLFGYQMVRANLKDAAIMWLLMFGVGLGWGIIMIPVFIVLLLLAVAVGGIPAWLLWQLTRLVWPALLVGIPLFLLIFIPPLVFLNGLYLVFKSSVWTLTYREFRARG